MRGCPCSLQRCCCRRAHSPSSAWLCSKSTVSRLLQLDSAASSCPAGSALHRKTQPSAASCSIRRGACLAGAAGGASWPWLGPACSGADSKPEPIPNPHAPAGVAGQVAQGGALQRQGAQVVAAVQVQAGQARQAQGQAAQAGQAQPQRLQACAHSPGSAFPARLHLQQPAHLRVAAATAGNPLDSLCVTVLVPARGGLPAREVCAGRQEQSSC